MAITNAQLETLEDKVALGEYRLGALEKRQTQLRIEVNKIREESAKIAEKLDEARQILADAHEQRVRTRRETLEANPPPEEEV